MDNLQHSSGGTFNLVTAALQVASGNVNLNIAVGTNAHVVDGVFSTRAANATIAWTVSGPSVYSTTADGSFTGMNKPASVGGSAVNGSTRLYGLYMAAGGSTLTVIPGPIVSSGDLALGAAALHFPPPQRNLVCFGCVRIAVTAGTAFIPGVTAQNAAGVTTTYINLFNLPGEPLRS